MQVADAIWREEIAKAGLDKEISQYYAALTNMHLSLIHILQAYSGASGSVEVDSRAFRAEPRMIGVSSPGKSYSVSSSRI